jgi:hypothetical protein
VIVRHRALRLDLCPDCFRPATGAGRGHIENRDGREILRVGGGPQYTAALQMEKKGQADDGDVSSDVGMNAG